jgi:uncharacterized protein YvpB
MFDKLQQSLLEIQSASFQIDSALGNQVLIDVPYRSQWDADAQLSTGDCGIVSVAMICNWKGISITPDQLIRKAGLATGRSLYSFAELMLAGKAVGLNFRYVRPARWDDIRAELDAGRPVIPLLRYGELIGNQDVTFTGGHFLVVVGYDTNGVYVNDSNWWGSRRLEGFRRRIAYDRFERCIGEPLTKTGNSPFQSLFLD